MTSFPDAMIFQNKNPETISSADLKNLELPTDKSLGGKNLERKSCLNIAKIPSFLCSFKSA